jgi:hypothetical protein
MFIRESRIPIVIHPGSRILDPTTTTEEEGKKFVVPPFFVTTNITELKIISFLTGKGQILSQFKFTKNCTYSFLSLKNGH